MLLMIETKETKIVCFISYCFCLLYAKPCFCAAVFVAMSPLLSETCSYLDGNAVFKWAIE